MKKAVKFFMILGMVMALGCAPSITSFAEDPPAQEGDGGGGEEAGDEGGEEDTPSTPDDSGEPASEEGAEQETAQAETDAEQGDASAEKLEEITAESIVHNAIQDQINDAIQGSSGDECFVEVAEGTYDGDLTITAVENKAATIYILAEGSYTKDDSGNINKESINAAADGNTRMNGDINVDGLHVVLAGIYFSMGNTIAVKEGIADVYGTSQDDTIEVELDKNAMVKVYGGAGSDTIILEGNEEVKGGEQTTETGSIDAEVFVNDDDEEDIVEIDISAGSDTKPVSSEEGAQNAAETTIKVNGKDEDRIHLSGSLKDSDVGDPTKNTNIDTELHYAEAGDAAKTYVNITGTSDYDIHIVAEKDLKTMIKTSGVGRFTDELEHKIEVQVNPQAIAGINYRTFVNYVCNAPNAETVTIDSVTIPADMAERANSTKFSQLVIGNLKGKTIINGTVNTNGMNLLVRGSEIEINGQINAGSGDVVVRAADDDLNLSTEQIYEKYAPKFIKDIIGKSSPVKMTLSIFNVKSAAKITTAEGSNITGARVDLKSYSKQSKSLVPYEELIGLDFVAVKITDAIITLKGAIGATSIIGRAIANTQAKASNDVLAKWYIPVATAVLLGEAGVFVQGAAAVLNATKTIKLFSDSDIKVSVSSTVGALPISVAVVAAMNDSHVEVSGGATVTAANKISSAANGRLIATTKSHVKEVKKDKKDGKEKAVTEDDAKSKTSNTSTETADKGKTEDKSKNKYGGFVSVAVALQDVAVKILNDSKVTSSKNDVFLNSSALESVVTSAIATAPKNVVDTNGNKETGNGSVASKDDEKSEADEASSSEDKSDVRSVENTEKTAGDIMDAAATAVDQDGKPLEQEDKDKINKLKAKITGDEDPAPAAGDEDPAPPADGDGKTTDDDETKENTGISEAINKGTEAADVAEKGSGTTKSKLQLAGAFAVNIVSNKNAVLIEGDVTATNGSVTALAEGNTISKAVANATGVNGEDEKDSEGKKNALGAAVSVNVARHYNVTEVKSGNVTGKSAKLIALSGGSGMPVSVITEAIAGLSGNDAKDGYGIAGAIAVDVATIKTKAIAATKCSITADNIDIKAVSNEVINSIAKSNVEVTGNENKKLGIGAAIAVGVNGVDTIAAVGDDKNHTIIKKYVGEAVENFAVTADHSLNEEITATAGSVADTAVSPSVVVDVSGAHTESYSYIKPLEGNEFVVSGDYTQTANNIIDRTLKSDASSETTDGNAKAGSGTLLVSVLNDTANAKSKSSIKANNIKVNATGTSKVKGNTRSSSKGAAKSSGNNEGEGSDEEGDGDKQADQAIDGAKDIASENGSENINEESVEELTQNRQQAQTTEGNVSVSAAITVNVMNNSVRAELIGDVVNATEAIAVESTNTPDVYMMADASAVTAKRDADGKVDTKDGTGVGVAATVNVVNIENIATIQSVNDISAGSISVKSTVAGEKEVLEIKVPTQTPVRAYSVSGAGAAGVGVAGSVAVQKISGDADAFIISGKDGAYKKITSSTGNTQVESRVMLLEEAISTASARVDKDKAGKDSVTPDAKDDSSSKSAEEGSKEAEDGQKVADIDDRDHKNDGQEPTPENSGEAGKDTNTKPDTDDKGNPKNPDKGASDDATAVGVGASVVISISGLRSNAYIKAFEIETAKELVISATEDNIRRTYSVAGTDPIASGAATNTKTAVDAAVAFLYANDEVKAYTNDGINVKTNQSTTIKSEHTTKTRTQAGGFAVGNRSAVGAAVAVNISKADVNTTFNGSITSGGIVTISSKTKDSDYSFGTATAMGTTTKKGGDPQKGGSEGDDQPGEKNENNATAKEVNKALNDNKSEKATGDADNKKAFSTNVLKTQGSKTESTSKDSEVGKVIEEAEKTANEEADNKDKAGVDGDIKDGGAANQEGTEVNVAAAVGINVTIHRATTTISGSIQTAGRGVKLTADNNAAFSTIGTAYTMTQLLEDADKAVVAVGVAVAVNKDVASVKVADNTTILTVNGNNRGEITISSTLAQNTDNVYCASQAVAGSIVKKSSKEGGKKAKVGAAGAVAILISNADSGATVGNNFFARGNNISVTATDEYKLLVRAGSLSYASKANVGVGAAVGMLYANDKVNAIVGDNANIEGTSFVVKAEKKLPKKPESFLDYLTKAMAVYGAYTDNETVSGTTKEDGEREVTVKQPDFKSMPTTILASNVINIFINDNYHIESFSGSFAGGDGSFNGAGAISLGFLNTEVNAHIGQNAVVSVVKTDAEAKDGMVVSAYDSANTGIYTIGVSGASAKTSAGASIAVVIDKSKTNADIGPDAQINIKNGKGFELSAKTEQGNILISVVGAVSTSSDENSKALGGNVNVFYSEHQSTALLDSAKYVQAGNGITIEADSDIDTLFIAAGAQGSKGAAAGGVISVGIYNTTASADATSKSEETILVAEKGDINVKAHSKERLISVIASASASIKGSGIAAVINVLVSKSKVHAEVNKAQVNATTGSFNVVADSVSNMTLVDAAVALGFGSNAIGGIVAVTVLKRTVEALVNNAKDYGGTYAGGSVLVSATGDDQLLQVLAMGGAAKNNALGGIISVTVEENNIKADVENSDLIADGSIGISAYLNAVNLLITAALEGSGKTAVGGVINTSILGNTITADMGAGHDLSAGAASSLALPSLSGTTDDEKKNKKRNTIGISISADELSKNRIVGISGAGAGDVAVTGVINTVVSSSKVKARSRAVNVTAGKKEESSDKNGDGPQYEVEASSNTDIVDAAGSLSGAGKVGVGATVVTYVYSAEVEASSENSAVKAGSITIKADKDDGLFLVSASLAGAGNVAVSIAPNVLVYQNDVKAYIEADNITTSGNILVDSSPAAIVDMLGAALAVAGTAGVNFTGNIIYFKNVSEAHITAKGSVTCKGLLVQSDTTEKMNADCASLGGGGTAAVGGAVDLVISDVKSIAYIGNGSHIISDDSVEVDAIDRYTYYSIVGALGVAGTAAVTVNAIIGVISNTVCAYIGDDANVEAKGAVLVNATSYRRVSGFSGFVGASGTAAVGVSVAVFVTGKGIDKDTHDSVFGKDKGNVSTDNILNEAFGKSSKKAKNSVKGDINSEISTAVAPNKESAQAVSRKGGDYENYANKNGESEIPDSLINDTSSNLKQYENDGTATTKAYIGKNAVVVSKEDNVTVKADENVKAIELTGGVALSGCAGVSTAIAVAIIGSNVKAELGEGSSVEAAKSINVTANLGHDISDHKIKPSSNPIGQLGDALTNALNKKNDLEKEDTGTPRDLSDFGVLTLAVGLSVGGTAGVGITVTYTNNSSEVKALVNGQINQKNGGNNANVTATADLGNIGVFTGTIGGGFVGVAATVALSTVEAVVEASVNGKANHPSIVQSDLNVSSTASAKLITINGALAAGAVGAALIVAISNNRISSDAHIGTDTALDVKGNLNVKSKVAADLKPYIANVAAGAIGAAVSVSIANNRSKSVASLGGKDSKEPDVNAFIKASNITVDSTMKGDTKAVGRSFSAGAIAANGAVVIATQKGTNNALINCVRVSTQSDNGKVDITAGMDGNARVDIAALSAGAIAAGAAVAVALIDSENKAYANLHDTTLMAGTLNVEAKGASDQYYKTSATTTVISGSAGAVAAAFNFAYATNNAKNIAAVNVNKKLVAKDVKVQAYAQNTALAIAANGGAGAVTANVTRSRALLKGENKAEFIAIADAEVTVTSIDVGAHHNLEDYRPDKIDLFTEGKTITVEPSVACEAWIYSGAAGLASLAANVVTAKSDFTVVSNIIFNGDKINVDGLLRSIVDGSSQACAKSANITFAAASFGVIEAECDAAGTYVANISDASDKIRLSLADGIVIRSSFISTAETYVEPAKTGVSASLVEHNVNRAIAKATTNSTAKAVGLSGNVGKNLIVESAGKTKANATIVGAKFAASGVSMATNYANAQVNAANKAFISGTGRPLHANDVSVKATLSEVTAYAKGGSSQSGGSIKLIGGDFTEIIATSTVDNEAYVQNIDLKATGKVGIISDVAGESKESKKGDKKVHVTAEATAPDFSVGIATAQATRTTTDETGNISARVGGNTTIECKEFTLYSGLASEVSSIGSAPGVSVAIFSGDSVQVVTEASKNNDRRVVAAVENGSSITTTSGSISINAVSDLLTKAHLNDLKSYSGVKLGSFLLSTKVGQTRTAVEVVGSLYSLNAINIIADDYYKSQIDDLVATNVALLDGTTTRSIAERAQQTSEVIIGSTDGKESNVVTDVGAIMIHAITSADMSSYVTTSSGSVASKTKLESRNDYTRLTKVTINDNVLISATDNVSIIADAQKATIKSKTFGNTDAGYANGSGRATINNKATTTVNIGQGNDISSFLGKIEIIARVAEDLNADAGIEMHIAVANNEPYAEIISNDDVYVNINYSKDPVSSKRKTTKIAGCDVEIASYFKDISHVVNCTATSVGIGSDTKAESKLTSNNNVNVDIGLADISGYETLRIFSLASDLKEEAQSYARIQGATGKVYGYTDLSGGINSYINVGSSSEQAILRGPDILIQNTEPDSISVKRTAKADGDTIVNKIVQTIEVVEEVVEKIVDWLPWPFDAIVKYITKKITKLIEKVIEVVTYSKCEVKETGTYTVKGHIDLNIGLYAGQYGAGINVKIDENKKVRTAGLARGDVGRFIEVGQDKIEIHDLKAEKAGKFTVIAKGNPNSNGAAGRIELFNATFISSLNIENSSTLPLYLRRINMLGTPDVEFAIELNIPDTVTVTNGVAVSPEVSIVSAAGGDVVFGVGHPDSPRAGENDLDIGEGKLTVLMLNGGNVNTESAGGIDAFVVANDVSITGASYIGKDNPFRLLLASVAPASVGDYRVEDKAGSLTAAASHSVNILLTPARIFYKQADDSTGKYVFNQLTSNNIILQITKPYYTTVVKSGIISGDFIQGMNRTFIAKDRDCEFAMGNVTAAMMKVVADAGSRTYKYNNAPNTTFTVRDLILQFTGENIWEVVNSYIEPNGNSENEYYDGEHDRVDPFIAQLINAIKNSVLPTGTDQTRNDLARKYRHRTGSALLQQSGRDGSFVNRNYQFFDEIRMEDFIGRKIENLISGADLSLIVPMSGWNYLIVASNKAVKDMIGSIGKDSTAGKLSDAERFTSVILLTADETLMGILNGFNYLYVMVPAAIGLLLFLFLTRRKKDEEEK